MTPLELNLQLEKLFQLLFLNIYISPLLWYFMPTIVDVTFSILPISPFKLLCNLMAILSLYVTIKRNNKGITEWNKEIVIITGATSGMGAELADLLIKRGATVVNIDRLEPKDQKSVYFKCDLTKYDEIKDTIAQIKEKVGTPTMLVNNAGIVNGKSFVDLTVEQMENLFSCNLMSHLVLLKLVLPMFLENNKGHIVIDC